MSNFEAKFQQYLHSLTISRSEKNQIETDWKKFHRFIGDRYRQKDAIFHHGFNSRLFSDYILRMRQKYTTSDRADIMKSVFDHFRHYLGREKKLRSGDFVLDGSCKSLLLTYLADLEHKENSPATIRNYQADLLQSFIFLSSEYKGYDVLARKGLPEGFDKRHQSYLQETLNLSASSIKRKSSTLRSFVSWAERKGYFTADSNDHSSSSRVRGLADVTIPNGSSMPNGITSDNHVDLADRTPENSITRHILPLTSAGISLLCVGLLFFRISPIGTVPPEHPSNSPLSVLRYEGRLTDEGGNAVIEKSTARFRLWDDPSGGTVLYDSQSCSLEPDHNGLFSVLIGSSCGKNIPTNLLGGHLPLYLGISVAEAGELIPRQPLATAHVAQNSFKLSGLSAANPASGMTIPYINQNGTLAISASSPLLQSQKGTFTLEGQSLLLKTAGRTGGSITLAPDDLGTVDIQFTDSLGRDNEGMMNIRNTNMITGTLLFLRGSVLTTGYNFIDFRSGSDNLSRFRIDAAGNASLAGSLNVENVLEASSSGILLKTALVNTDLNYDGGLGVYGSRGNPIPVPLDFTRSTRIEFGFKLSGQPMHADINLSEDRLKFYRVFWNTDGMMGIAACTPTCRTLGSSILSRNETSWHHGYIEFSSGSLHWNIDNNQARTTVKESLEIAANQKAYLRFSDTIPALSQLRISQTGETILTSGNSQIGGSLLAGGNIMTDNQVRTGNFSGNPTAAGSGAIYFNTSDNMLYYWNGTSWVSDTFWKREGNALYPHPSYAADLNLGIGTTTPQGRVNIQDTSQEQLRLSWDTTHYARFLSSSSGTLAIDPTGDLLVSGNLSVGSGGVLFPSENATHAEQSEYFLSADTGAGGLIRTNALGFGASGSDFAEVFVTEDPVEVGDVVMLANSVNQHSVYTIAKSNLAYSDKIIGVVTDRAAFVGGLNDAPYGKPTATVGILGRVPIHVSGQNGPIRRGDPLASSSVPGYAMLATERGPIIARALEDFPAVDSSYGTILSFVQLRWFEPPQSLQIAGDLLLDDPQFGELAAAVSEAIYQSTMTNAKQLIVDSARFLTVQATEIVTRTLRVEDTAEISTIQTQRIEPPFGDDTLSVHLPDSSSGFGKLLIENDRQQTVASIDSLGNAEFAGDATVAGTLYARSIESTDFQSLQSSFSALLARYDQSSSSQIVPSLTEIPSPTPSPADTASLTVSTAPSSNPDNLLAQLPQQLADSRSLQERMVSFLSSSSGFLASSGGVKDTYPLRIVDNIEIPPDLRLDSLHVVGSTTLADTAIAGQLFVDGTLVLENNALYSLSDKLSLTAQQAISLMGDRLIVDSLGNLTTSGWLIAKEGIITNRIASSDGIVTIDLAKTDPTALPRIGAPEEPGFGQTFGMLMVKGLGNTPVTTVDQKGNLTTDGTLTAAQAQIHGVLRAEKIDLTQTRSASISANRSIDSADHYVSRGINAPAIYAVTSAGTATIPAGSHELYIYYRGISEDSLIYITPTSMTQNRTLFVADKIPGSHAIIGLDVAISTPIRFNWWIIN